MKKKVFLLFVAASFTMASFAQRQAPLIDPPAKQETHWYQTAWQFLQTLGAALAGYK